MLFIPFLVKGKSVPVSQFGLSDLRAVQTKLMLLHMRDLTNHKNPKKETSLLARALLVRVLKVKPRQESLSRETAQH